MRILSSRQRGVSLIEVLVAVLIFSLGLIGLAGLMVFASQSNHSGYLRTQASFLASNMADRMRANPAGVWDNDYNEADFPVAASSAGAPACDASAPCSPTKVADRDKILWSDMLNGFLPGAKASISCTPASDFTPSADQIKMRPPYGGDCTMRITWNERGVATDRSAQPQTFAWVFQP